MDKNKYSNARRTSRVREAMANSATSTTRSLFTLRINFTIHGGISSGRALTLSAVCSASVDRRTVNRRNFICSAFFINFKFISFVLFFFVFWIKYIRFSSVAAHTQNTHTTACNAHSTCVRSVVCWALGVVYTTFIYTQIIILRCFRTSLWHWSFDNLAKTLTRSSTGHSLAEWKFLVCAFFVSRSFSRLIFRSNKQTIERTQFASRIARRARQQNNFTNWTKQTLRIQCAHLCARNKINCEKWFFQLSPFFSATQFQVL